MSSTIVHALAPSQTRSGVLFAADGNGIDRHDAGGWRRQLIANTAWSVALLPDGRTLLAGDEAGNVDISHDAGDRWVRHPLSPEGVYAVTASPADPRIILAGAGGGIFRSADGGTTWQRRLTLQQSAGAAFAWQPGSRAIVFAGAVAGGTSGATQVYVSRDAGLHWRLFGSGLRSLAGIMALNVGPTGYLFAGTMGNRIWRIPLSGASWTPDAAGIPAGQHVAAIAVVPGHRREDSPRLYVATLGRGIFVSRDAGSRWTSVSDGLPSAGGDQIVLALAYSSRDHTLYAGTTNGVYRLNAP
jgi:hypothetical protein